MDFQKFTSPPSTSSTPSSSFRSLFNVVVNMMANDKDKLINIGHNSTLVVPEKIP